MYARIICTNNGTHVTLTLVMSGSEISLISLPFSDMLHEKEQERNNKYTLFLIHLNSYNQKLNALKISNIVKIYVVILVLQSFATEKSLHRQFETTLVLLGNNIYCRVPSLE